MWDVEQFAPYFEAGFVAGFDASFGPAVTRHETSLDDSLRVNQIEGWGHGTNVGVDFLDFSYGGNAGGGNFREGPGANYAYQSATFGASIGSPFGLTVDKSRTLVWYTEQESEEVTQPQDNTQ